MEQGQIPPQLSNSTSSPGPATPAKKSRAEGSEALSSSKCSREGTAEEAAGQLDVSTATCDTSRDSDVSTAASPEREFSILPTNFDRGQLKLRIASKPVNRKASSCAPDKECESSPSGSGDEGTEVFQSTKSDITECNLDSSVIKEASTSKKVRC